VRTLAVVYGDEWTRRFIRYLSPAPILLLVFYVASGLLPVSYLLVASGLGLVREIGVRGFERRAEWFENTVSWLCFYIGLGLIYILSYLAEVI